MKLTTFCQGLLLALGVAASAPQAGAVTLKLDGSWTVGNEVKNTDGTISFADSWSWKSNSRVELCLMDLYVIGDIFAVYDNGKLLDDGGLVDGFNPLVPGDYAAMPADALRLGSFSSGCWTLGPGEHVITVLSVQRPGGAYVNDPGGLALRVRQVPEGGTGVWLLGASMAGLMGWRWKHRPKLDSRGAA